MGETSFHNFKSALKSGSGSDGFSAKLGTFTLEAKKDSDNETEPSSEDDIEPDACHDSEYELHSDTEDEEDNYETSDLANAHELKA
ncbi:hypothetical protein CHS0354_016680 [Potamilus streckersoni]|uniref:Uncharacterized protein n=1 Tax=Potamilus streckersoni TaxID=2493646 RepID=A0AAE0THH3_9BIVA|nr:hypothetical protein CHS0354_016680 [Potamilus streckersoni]